MSNLSTLPITPLKPRRGLLIVCSVLLVLWIAGMVLMYFKTVYPYRTTSPVHPVDKPESLRR